MKTILEILNLSIEFLNRKGFPHPRRQAQDLLSRALSIKPMDLYLLYDRPLTDSEVDKCRLWLKRRIDHEPAAYIDGKVEFFDCVFDVSPDVLIPRQETEILAGKITEHLRSEPKEGLVLWDVCTGSGCLAVSLKKKFPFLHVFGSDFSSSALKMAVKNAERNEVEVGFLEGDLFDPYKSLRADYIVCNPPYISESEYQELEVDVREFEPRMALVGGKTGLEFYDRLAKELPSYLQPGGKVWLEVGGKQGDDVYHLFSDKVWKTKRLEKDWAGWDRFFFLEIE